MSIDLNAITAKKNILPPRLVIYGPPKIGKTTLLASIPHNLLVDVEGGSNFQNVARIEKEQVATFDQYLDLIGDLYTQNHNFTTFSTDTVDWLETIVFAKAAEIHGRSTIADVDYGKGFATAQNLWKQLLDGLDALRKDKGMMILMAAHEQIRVYNNPMTESYDRYTLKLQDKDKGSSTASLIKEWADGILFVNKETFVRKEKADTGKKEIKKGIGGDRVFFHTQESPAFVAGNRIGLPAQIPFTWEALSEALTTALS